MTLTKQRIDDKLTVTITGRLDSTNAMDLERDLKPALAGVKELVFNLEGLDYMSSAGLRIFVACQKIMNRQGSMTVCKPTELVRKVFDITGVSGIVNIEG